MNRLCHSLRRHSIANAIQSICLLLAILTPGATRADQLDGIRPEFVIEGEEIRRTGIADVFSLLVNRGGSNIHGIGRPGVLDPFFTVFLINGRPIPTVSSTYTLESLPVSAIERIEVYGSSRATSIGEDAIGGAVNIILRRDFEGTEFRTGVLRPRADGGDSDHASLTWGGPVGEGHMVVGLDILRHGEIRDADRDFGRASYDPDAPTEFSKTSGVSFAGNTVFYLGGDPIGRHAATLGACEGEGYVRILDPVGYVGEGCGFAYADVTWHTSRFERNAAHVSLDHPFGDNSEIYVEARHAWSKSRQVLAPTPSLLTFIFPSEGFKQLDSHLQLSPGAPDNRFGFMFLGHRFVGHGNRVWKWSLKETDLTVGVRSQLDSGVELDSYVRTYRHDADEVGNAFVDREKIHEFVESRAYSLAEPTQASAEVLADSTVTQNRTGSIRRRSAGLALSGAGEIVPGRDVQWRLGVEVEHRTLVNLFDNRGRTDLTGRIVTLAGNSVEGTRYRRTGYSEVEFPVTERWDVILGARLSDYNDVGDAGHREIASRFRVNDKLTLRGSLSAGERAPSLYAVNAREEEFHAHAELPNGEEAEVTVRTRGNPNIRPYDTEAINLGFAASAGPADISIDWFRIDQSGSPVVPTAQSVINRSLSGEGLPDDIKIDSDHGHRGVPHYELDVPWVNLEDKTRSGIDARLATGWKTGSIDWSLDTRWLYVDKARSTVFGKEKDDPLTPRNRVHNLVRAGRGNLSADWSFNYVSGYRDDHEDDSYPSWKGHDISLNWKRAFGNEGVEFTAGMLNVTDEGPPVLPTAPDHHVSSLDTYLGRSLFVTTSITW